MPIVFAFCRTAASVRFIAFATSTTGVLALEWALSCRMSSLSEAAGGSLLSRRGFHSSLKRVDDAVVVAPSLSDSIEKL